MDNKPKFNPTIAFVAVLAFILIIVLVFTLRSDSDEMITDKQPPDSGSQVEQPVEGPEDPEPQPPTQPVPQPGPVEPVNPTPTPPAEGELPADWSTLSSAEKTERNPFGCDIQTQWISADDGSCIDKQPALPHNGINLDLAQDGSMLLAVYDGRPEDGFLFEGSYDQLPTIAGIRVGVAEDCHPGMEVPPYGSYDRVPHASQHWTVDYTFKVGYYDIDQYICARAEFSSGRVHTQAVRVKSFQSSGVGIRFNIYRAKLTVYTEDYLPVGVPAWEYIGLKNPVTDFNEDNCSEQTFATYETEVVSETFNHPQHFFQTFGDGFGFHGVGNTAKLVINLTEADIGKVICFKVRNSFGEVEYKGLVIDRLQWPQIVT